MDGARRAGRRFRYITFPQLRGDVGRGAAAAARSTPSRRSTSSTTCCRPRAVPAVRPATAGLPVLHGARAGPGLRPRQRRRGDPGAAHRRRDAGPGPADAASEAGGLTRPWPSSGDAASTSRRGTAARRLRRCCIAVGAVLFLVPFYLLLRNGLSTEADITSPDWTFFPSSLQWGNIAELFDDPAVPMARALVNSRGRRRRCRPRWLLLVSAHGRLRAGPHPVPLRQRRLLRDPGHPDDPGGGDLRAELRAGLHARLGQHPARPDRPGAVQAFATLPVPAVLPGLPAELEEAARVDGLGYSGTFWRVVVPNSLGLLRRDRRRSPSSAAGTRSCGRWSSARTRARGPCRSRCRPSSPRRPVNLHELFIAAAVSILPLLVVFLFLQRWIVQGVERSGIND